jgi:hypothetical protein
VQRSGEASGWLKSPLRTRGGDSIRKDEPHRALRDCQNLLPTSLSSFSRLSRVTREHL